MPIGTILGALGGGLFAGLGSLGGAAISSNAAQQAAQLQAQAAQNALNFEQGIYGQTQTDLAPFLGTGTNALIGLAQNVGVLPSPGGGPPSYSLVRNPQDAFGPPPTLGPLPTYGPTAGQFQASPGYAWQLGQGINAIQNAATGPQGTLSGNMLKAAQTYGTGLANQDYYNWINQVYNPTYQSQLNNVLLPYNAATSTYWQNVGQAGNTQQNFLSLLAQLAGAGQNAAAQQGGFGAGFGQQAGNLITGAGAARAAGAVGSANALNQGITNFLTPAFGSNYGGGTGIGNALQALFSRGNPNSYTPFVTSLLNSPSVGDAYATQTTSPSYGY